MASSEIFSKPPALIAWLVASVASLMSFSANAQETNYEKALAEITKTAEKICQSAPLEQTSDGLSLTGDAQAKLGGVVGKIADLGVSGSAKYETGKSLGVLQKDLIQAIQIGNNCKLEVFRVLERDLIQNRQSSPQTVSPPIVTPKKEDHYVPSGAATWSKFPADVKQARSNCLQRLFLYGTHPESFQTKPSSPNEWDSFVGRLTMRLSRDPKSLEIISVDFKVVPYLDGKGPPADESRSYSFGCQFQGGRIVSSSFF